MRSSTWWWMLQVVDTKHVVVHVRADIAVLYNGHINGSGHSIGSDSVCDWGSPTSTTIKR